MVAQQDQQQVAKSSRSRYIWCIVLLLSLIFIGVIAVIIRSTWLTHTAFIHLESRKTSDSKDLSKLSQPTQNASEESTARTKHHVNQIVLETLASKDEDDEIVEESEDYRTAAFYAARQDIVVRMVEEIRKNHFDRMSYTWFPPKFITPLCHLSVKDTVKGTDGFRGLVVAFYLAIATSRLLNIDCRVGESAILSDFFDVNDRFYDMRKVTYLLHRSRATQGDSRWAAYVDGQLQINDLEKLDNLLMSSTNFTGLQEIFDDKKFSEVLYHVMPSLFDNMLMPDYNLVISAALQTIFARTTDAFKDQLDGIIEYNIGLTYWYNSIKIGVHASDQGNGTSCFIKAILTVLANLRKVDNDAEAYTQVTIVLCGFSTAMKTQFEEELQLLAKRKYFLTIKVFSPSHFVERSLAHSFVRNRSLAWHSIDWVAPGSIDIMNWYLLTQMNALIIDDPDSSFYETAVYMSLAPAKRVLKVNGQCQLENIMVKPKLDISP